MSGASERFLPYGRQEIDEDDVAAVTEVPRGDWLTTRPAPGNLRPPKHLEAPHPHR